MKKLFSLLLIIVLLTSAAVPSFSAADNGLTIEDGVLISYVGTSASLTVPEGVTAIAPRAFEGNTALASVTLPASLYTVGDMAFYNCSALSVVKGGTNVSLIGEKAFANTPWLDNSTDRYFMLGTVLLWYNGTAASVSIPTACTAVAPYAFMKCDTLSSFTAHDGLIGIGTGAFYNCSKLTEVNLPASVSDIGAYAFDGTPFIEASGDFVILGDGVLARYNGAESDVVIPDTVKRVSSRAFRSSKMNSVRIPPSVFSVDPYAFADCTGLEILDLSEGLINIGDGAFRGCKSLGEVTIPASLAYIGQYAFSGDSSLDHANLIGNGLTVSDNAFKNCDSMSYVLLSDSVEAVNGNAFKDCSALCGLSVSAATKNIASSAFSGCDAVTLSCEDGAYAGSGLNLPLSAYDKGDVDHDGVMTIVDASDIQMYLALLYSFSGEQAANAELDYDGIITINDALLIQQTLAHLR